MTYRDEKLLRELEKPLARACKEIGKRRGWKTIAAKQYQVREGTLYVLYTFLPPLDFGRAVKASFRCKPVALDEMYWEVFHMKEEAARQPFSFHVSGAFTARGLALDPWKEPLPSPEELLPTLEAVFDRAEAMMEQNRFPDFAAFRRRLEAEDAPSHTLDIILCLLCEGDYPRALEAIESALARKESGGFLRESGRRSIMEDARDWCAAKLGGV